MKRNNKDLQASVQDRLIDHEPGVSREPVQQRLLSIGEIKASVLRHVENLLNTRRQIIPVPPELREVRSSMFEYGIQDFTSKNPSPHVKQQLRQDIEATISRFESRLKNVTVQFDTATPDKRNIRFRISALLIVEPLTEPVTFDTYFDINRGEYTISQ